MADSYRDELKAASQDGGNSQAPESEASREAYKARLRALAGGSESTLQTDSSQSGLNPQKAGTKNESTVDGPPAPLMDIIHQVSTREEHSSAKVQSGDGTPISTPSACSDKYCRQLRKVAEGEPPTNSSLTAKEATSTTEHNFVKNLAFDQLHIWSSPFQLRDYDATWAFPFGLVTGTLVATDHDTSKQLAKPSREDISNQISNAGLFGMIGAGAGFYGLGIITHDDHKRETGLLSGEAFINATLVAEALKLAFGRQRPFEGDGFGHIGKGGTSFPSEHAIGTFAIASVFAREYPNPFVQVGAYGLASAVSFARVTAGQHFPSDVFVGSVLGYFIGKKIYGDHHNPDLGGAEYGTFVTEHKYDADHSGSSYVPLESWVYPIIDRLSALGYVHTNFDSERPWTRLECARLTSEATENAAYGDAPADVSQMIESLQREFTRESEVRTGDSDNRSAELESVYTRATEIAGPVLRDGYHFGQTLYDDYGRPYGQGFNYITGFSARATSGPLVFYFRGEYQHARENPNYTDSQKALITVPDFGTPVVDNEFPAADHFQVLDAYLGVNFGGHMLTVGQESLWWGPGSNGPLMFTNNAQPLPMIRLNSTSPIEIPLLSKFLGPLRYDIFLGQTNGYHYLQAPQGLVGPHLGTQPFVQGQRFTFKPTPNFEFGLTRTGVFGGTGYPLTLDYLFRTTFTTANYEAGSARKPGDRRSGIDFTYRIPKLRDWLTWYAEAFSEDEVSPLFFPRTSAMRSGIYAPKLPGLPHVDLRVEGAYTDVPGFGQNPGYFYFNGTYRDGFTNYGDIMGNWIGRDGRGVTANSKIWLSARNSIQLGYREGVVDHEFIEGGRYQDFSVGATFNVKPDIDLSGSVQYEGWRFPVLSQLPQSNVAASLQLVYWPKLKLK